LRKTRAPVARAVKTKPSQIESRKGRQQRSSKPKGVSAKKPTITQLTRELAEARPSRWRAPTCSLISHRLRPWTLEALHSATSCAARAASSAPTAAARSAAPTRAGQDAGSGRRADPSDGTATGRALLELKPVQILDVRADPEYDIPELRVRIAQMRTALAVPLLRNGTPVGVITLWKNKVEAFSDRQIDLVTTFADQAVIAIENVRLFEATQAHARELTEALDRQTATSDVLRIVSGSPGELAGVRVDPANAMRMCQGQLNAPSCTRIRYSAWWRCRPRRCRPPRGCARSP
jgi:GAF domain-containing protein